MTRSRFASLAVLALASAAASLSCQPAPAQVTVNPASPGPAPAAPTIPPLTRLKIGLDSAYWDPAQRGPLIAVAPENALPAWQTAIRQPQIGPDGNYVSPKRPDPPVPMPGGQYRMTELADFFGRRIVRLGGLSVLAPTEMVVLNARPGKPDYFANLTRAEKARMLQASLTADQWKLLGSEGGLGANDLSGNQRDLFLSYLPDPLIARWSRSTGGEWGFAIPDRKPVIVSGDARSAVRLRMNRSVQFKAPVDMGGASPYNIPLSTGTAREYAALVDNRIDNRDTLFGQKIRTLLPNRLKPQQIDFAAPALQAVVSLADLGTVGDLVRRIRTVTHTEIVVDGRVAKMALWIRAGDGQTVRAGEALQALCWSLTGAIRYVSDQPDRSNGVFILTQDGEGIGARLARISEWGQAAQTHASQTQNALRTSIQKQQPLQYIGFAPGDPNALDSKNAKTVEDSLRTQYQARWNGTTMPLADLTPQQQESVREGIAAYQKSPSTINGQPRNIIQNGTISAAMTIRYNLVVPGVGEVAASGFDGYDSLDDFIPITGAMFQPTGTAPVLADTASIPANLPLGEVLCVSPATGEDAAKAVRAARERGMKQVWIVLPAAPSDAGKSEAVGTKSKALLAAAIAESEKQKPSVAILAGVRLFSLPASLPTVSLPPAQDTPSATNTERDIRDITVTGELPTAFYRQRTATFAAAEAEIPGYFAPPARDWTRLDTPGLPLRIVRALREIAGTPGLAGMALLDTAPPGYCLPVRNAGYYVPASAIDVGYTPRARLAFIRRAGYDPIDLVSLTSIPNVNLSLPFFADDDRYRYGVAATDPNAPDVDAGGQWNRFRTEIVSQVLTDLYTPLMTALSAMPDRKAPFPVYLQNLDSSLSSTGWFSHWEKAESLPHRAPAEPGKPLNTFGDAKAVSPVSLMEIPYRDNSSSSRQAPGVPPIPPIVQYARGINAFLTYEKGAWSGLVLNFSEVSVDKALEMIAGIVPAETARVPQKTFPTKTDKPARP